jgi:anti-anti-sigma factor
MGIDENVKIFQEIYAKTAAHTSWRSIVEDPEPNRNTELLIPGYDLLNLLGKGGMGVVYKARQQGLDRYVAIKVIKRGLAEDPEFLERFSEEVKAGGRLHHDNIVASLACGTVDERPYLVMEFVEGCSLAQILKQHGPLGESQVLEIARQVATGLQYAWERQLIHRDIKPENILVTPRGVAKICDLGLVRAANSSAHITQTGTVNCTPAYASPEQLKGKRNLDTRTDIYSLGVTLYQLLTGVLPFEGNSPAELYIKHSSVPAVPPHLRKEGISMPTSNLVLEMMAKRRRARPASPGEVVEAIDAIRKGEDSPPTPVSVPTPHAEAAQAQRVIPAGRGVLEIAEIPTLPALRTRSYVKDSTMVLELGGRLSEVMERTLQSEFDKIAQQGFSRIVVDCAHLAYVNSRGVSIFIAVIDDLRENGGDLKLARLNAQSLTVFTRLGLTKFIQVFESVGAALKAFDTPIGDFLSDGGIDTFVGVISTKLFHTSACPEVGSLTTVNLYPSRKDAKAAGFTPCTRCGADSPGK